MAFDTLREWEVDLPGALSGRAGAGFRFIGFFHAGLRKWGKVPDTEKGLWV